MPVGKIAGSATDRCGTRAERLDWYDSIFELIDLRSFSNLWYWIALAVTWSMTSHWVLGVPFDMITRARRQGGTAQSDMETLVHINVARLTSIADVSGVWLAGFVGFGLTVLGVLGFYYAVEFAQALFLIVAPISAVGALSLRAARQVMNGQGSGDALFRLLRRHRVLVQVIGMVSILVTSMWGMYQNMQFGALGN
jgi:hypothetical protein